MSMRKDALAGAAEMMLSIEREARESADLVATVGVIECNRRQCDSERGTFYNRSAVVVGSDP